jgi:hypothetical protein
MVTLKKPTIGSVNWGDDVNDNWSTIEQYLEGGSADRVRVGTQVEVINANDFDGILIARPLMESDSRTALKDSTGIYVNMASRTTSNSDSGIYYGYGGLKINTVTKPVVTMAIKTGASSSDLQTCRIWMGLFSNDPMASDTPALHLAAFRYAPATDTTAYWRCVTDDGGGAPTVTATDIEIEADTRYVLKVDCTDPASIQFYINGTLVATHTTDLPSTSQDLGCWMQIRTLDAAAKNIRISKLDILI